MLEQFLQPQLFAGNILYLVVFQQDGTLPLFAHIVRNYLNETFPGRWIGRGSPRFWAARSRDLKPLDFFHGATSWLRWTRWRLGICSTCANAFRQQCIQLPQQCCSVCSGSPRRDSNSVWIWRAIMSNGNDFIKFRGLLPHYKHFIWNKMLVPRNG